MEATKENKKSKMNKVVLIGDAFVGKTSILNMLLTNNFTDTKPSIGALHHSYTIKRDNEEILLDLWDTAGQERFKSVVPMYYKSSKAIVVVFDITNSDTFEGAKKWVEEIETHNNTAILFLVGNKVDLETNRKINYDTAKLYAIQHKVNYFECSAKLNKNIKELFNEVAMKIPVSLDNGSNGKSLIDDVQTNSKGSCC